MRTETEGWGFGFTAFKALKQLITNCTNEKKNGVLALEKAIEHNVQAVENDLRKTLQEQAILHIWSTCDSTNIGYLNKEQTRDCMRDILTKFGKKEGAEKVLTNIVFETIFLTLEKDRSGKVEKDEMIEFIKEIIENKG